MKKKTATNNIVLEDKEMETNYEKSIEKWNFFKNFLIEKRSTLITVFNHFFKTGENIEN